MIRLAVAGLSLGLTLAPVAAMAQVDSRAGAPPVAGMPAGPGPMMRRMPPPPMQTPGGARWSQVPGGWNAYHRPSYGYTLPRYWIAPSFYISDWSSLGLPAPAPGFGWSHYYDDIVLTDRWGRVYDWRDGRNAGHGHEDYSDSYGYRDDGYRNRGDRNDGPVRRRHNDGLAGAVAGAVVGGVAGNVIAGHGDRLAGSLIGGGVGALAGQAIDRSATHDRRKRDTYDSGHDRYQSYGAPHWDDGYREQRQWGPSYGYSYGGDGGGTTVTTVFIDSAPSQPVVTRSVSYVTEYVSVPVRHRVVHHWKPRARPSCVCGS